MINYFEGMVLPIHLAKRFAENRDGEAIETHGWLEILRNGEFLRAIPINDGCVDYQQLLGALTLARSKTKSVPPKFAKYGTTRTAASFSHWGMFE